MNDNTYAPNATTSTWTWPTSSPSETVVEETERYYDAEGRMVREVVKRTVTKAPRMSGPYWVNPKPYSPSWEWNPNRVTCGSVTTPDQYTYTIN